ncbi:hypothetical protein AVEN_66097-1 [Araneus ventricosus]|uniref:Uncharacterized protein n=1 Tax=Araneus ventricosus TaxID=182803 RepID=A0A4Y2WF01_ARAVE|nr:hypothetical protein AVEN_66097-1 [Araneus ventricosus]
METLREAANQRARLFSLARVEVKVGYMQPGMFIASDFVYSPFRGCRWRKRYPNLSVLFDQRLALDKVVDLSCTRSTHITNLWNLVSKS